MILEKAFGKVNLWLKILHRREDGFHELSTLMAPLDLHDTVRLELCEHGIHLHCSGAAPDVPVDETNLACRAAALFFKDAGSSNGVDIFLEKRIPSGAGLGGGSSDAAAVLRGLQKLSSVKLPPETLHKIALQLGSDVPFFLESKPAICTGRGEVMDFSATLEPMELLLIKPPFPISTAWAYRRLAEMRTSSPGQLPTARTGEFFSNDLEVPVFEKYPILQILRTKLEARKGIKGACLSGSGSTIFAVIEDHALQSDITGEIQEDFGHTFEVLPATCGMATN